MAVASLFVGIVSSLGTPWGLFQHCCVLAKLVLTVFAIVVLLIQMPRIGLMASAAAGSVLSSADFRQDRLALVLHSGAGLLVLLIPLALSIYYPQGFARYGQRKQFHKASPPSAV